VTSVFPFRSQRTSAKREWESAAEPPGASNRSRSSASPWAQAIANMRTLRISGSRWVTRSGSRPARDRRSELVGDARPAPRFGEQHHAAVGTDPSAVKGGGDLLAVDGWKAQRQKVVVGHGGRGVPRSRQRGGFSNRILRKSLRNTGRFSSVREIGLHSGHRDLSLRCLMLKSVRSTSQSDLNNCLHPENQSRGSHRWATNNSIRYRP
jgi:hypothetical protein